MIFQAFCFIFNLLSIFGSFLSLLKALEQSLCNFDPYLQLIRANFAEQALQRGQKKCGGKINLSLKIVRKGSKLPKLCSYSSNLLYSRLNPIF